VGGGWGNYRVGMGGTREERGRRRVFVGCWHDEAWRRSHGLRSADSLPVPKLKINANRFTFAES